jgi:hypothetical protein
MPTYKIDPGSFTSCTLMAVAPRDKFGEPGTQDTAADGTPRWTAQVAVSHFMRPGARRPEASVLDVTVTSPYPPDKDCPPGPCVLEGLEAFITAPEVNPETGRVRGGRLGFSASAVRSLNGHRKADAA